MGFLSLRALIVFVGQVFSGSTTCCRSCCHRVISGHKSGHDFGVHLSDLLAWQARSTRDCGGSKAEFYGTNESQNWETVLDISRSMHEFYACDGIVFVREAADRLISSTLYHGKDPTPELTEKVFIDPCQDKSINAIAKATALGVPNATEAVSNLFYSCAALRERAYFLAKNVSLNGRVRGIATSYGWALRQLFAVDPVGACIMEFARMRTDIMAVPSQMQAIHQSGLCIRYVSMDQFYKKFGAVIRALFRWFGLEWKGHFVSQLKSRLLHDKSGHGTSSELSADQHKELHITLLSNPVVGPFLRAANQQMYSPEWAWLIAPSSSCP